VKVNKIVYFIPHCKIILLWGFWVKNRYEMDKTLDEIINDLPYKFTGIYKIESPNGKIYIGQSRCIKKRFQMYRLKECKTQKKLYNSLNKYGLDLHTFTIVESCSFNDMNIRERYWQDYYDVLNKGLNCILTETLELPRVLSEEMREDLSMRMKGNTYGLGKVCSEDRKKRIGDAQKGEKNHRWGKTNSESHVEAIKKANTGENNFMYGKKHDPETILRIKDFQKNRVRTNADMDHIMKLQREVAERQKVPVINLETGIYYDSIQEAEFTMNSNRPHLYRKLKGDRKNNTSFYLCSKL
jgi:group I intron endonuclease